MGPFLGNVQNRQINDLLRGLGEGQSGECLLTGTGSPAVMSVLELDRGGDSSDSCERAQCIELFTLKWLILC